MEITDLFSKPSPPPASNSALDSLVAESWGCIWPDGMQSRLMQWRYYDDSKDRTTLLATDHGRGVAMIDSVTRPYVLHGKPVVMRETGDWYCQETYRKFGLGLHLMRKLMRDYPEPMLVIGGSEANRAILSKLWHRLPSAYNYVLPVKARGFLGNLLRLTVPEYEHYAKILGPMPFRYPRRAPPPADACTVEPLTDWPDLPYDSTQELVGIATADHGRRLAAKPPEFGQPFGTIFRRNGAIVGCSLAQTEDTPSGKDGKILHIQTEANPDAALLRWIVAETSVRLAQREAEFIRCRASTPGKMAALRFIGYKLSQEIPCFWFDRTGTIAPPVHIDVDYLRGDDAQPMQALIGLYMKKRAAWRAIGGRLGTLSRGLESTT